MKLTKVEKPNDRRDKSRFPISRELRYKVVKESSVIESGNGQTADISSGGVCFLAGRKMEIDSYVELSISWPVLLDDSMPMRLIIFGRVLRSDGNRCACSIEKYEFRTQPRVFQTTTPTRSDSMLLRWAESLRKDPPMKSRTAIAV